MKKLFFVACVVLLVAACKKDNDFDPRKPGTGKLTLLKGSGQSGIFGEQLSDTIRLQFSSTNREDHFRITWAYIQGNGMIEHPAGQLWPYYYRDTSGTVDLLWRLGCDNTQQMIRFYIYTDNPRNSLLTFSDPPTDSITVSAGAVKPSGWCRSCGYGFAHDYLSKIVSPDNINLYLVNSGLFKSTDGGLNWYPVNGIPYSNEIVDAQFNSSNWLYVLTRLHGIYYTKDMLSWTAINTGILDMRDPTGFLVEDSALWVSFNFDGPYRSTNNGDFWRKLVIGGYSQKQTHFKRLPNGKMLLVDDGDDVKISENNGDNWSLLDIHSMYRTYQIYDLAVDAQGLLYIGSGDASISEYDINTATGTRHSYYEWNASHQLVNNITVTPTDVYYLVNYNPVPGIYRKSNNWGKVETGFNDRIDYYFLKGDGKFVLRSKNWLYYKD